MTPLPKANSIDVLIANMETRPEIDEIFGNALFNCSRIFSFGLNMSNKTEYSYRTDLTECYAQRIPPYTLHFTIYNITSDIF